MVCAGEVVVVGKDNLTFNPLVARLTRQMHSATTLPDEGIKSRSTNPLSRMLVEGMVACK